MTQAQQAKDILKAAAARQAGQRDAMLATSQDIATARQAESDAKATQENGQK